MTQLTNIQITQTLQTRTLLLPITFILFFTYLVFLNFPLTPKTSTFTTFNSNIVYLSNFTDPFPSHPYTTLVNTGAPEYRTPASGRNSYAKNRSSTTCDLFDGHWVYDNNTSLIYTTGSCPFVEDPFNCYKNGRANLDYLNYRWQPYGCDIPRFDRSKMSRMLKGKRLVFIGDSLNRNMCESLVCSLGTFDVSQRTYLSSDNKTFVIQGDDSSITMITAPFLVQQSNGISTSTDHMKNTGEKLHIDTIHETIPNYSDADILIFNTGHWWNGDKAQNGEYLFQEGDILHEKMNMREAYVKALNTWANWVDKNVDQNKTQVFFMGYTADHVMSRLGGSIRGCDKEIEPIKGEKFLKPYRWLTQSVQDVISKMSTPVVYLNITKLTAYRKDGHPARWTDAKVTRGGRQDCAHWCLPGVPDSWNQLLYSSMLLSSKLTN